MKSCFLEGYGPCDGKISREHYISENLLRAMSSTGSINIGGLPWQPDRQLQSIGISSLQSKILCERHNSGLTDLDQVAGRLYSTLDAADKKWPAMRRHSRFEGRLLERWLLKIICGLVAGPGIGNGEIPEKWKPLLLGDVWPDRWGLYVPALLGVRVLAQELSIETTVHPETRVILAAKFSIAGVVLWLLLGRPDDPAAFGNYRPRGLIFQHLREEKRVEFLWPFETNVAVYYRKIGSNNLSPPQWDGWKQPK
jgi:hypothetical protein